MWVKDLIDGQGEERLDEEGGSDWGSQSMTGQNTI
jgi:hypothetical protein